MASVAMDSGNALVGKYMAARRTKVKVGAYVALTSNHVHQYHVDPVCFNLGKSGKGVIRANVLEVNGQEMMHVDPDTVVAVTPCKCVENPRDLTRNWIKYAACHIPGVDLSDRFIAPGRDIEAALAICEECPVRLHCKDFGESEDRPRDVTIIWGGEAHRGRSGE